MNFTKIDKADFYSPRRELSNGGLGIVVALLVCWQIIFCRLIMDVQSRCTSYLMFQLSTPKLTILPAADVYEFGL